MLRRTDRPAFDIVFRGFALENTPVKAHCAFLYKFPVSPGFCGPLVKRLRQRPLTPLTSVRFRYGSPHCSLAQSVERMTVNHDVVSSSLTGAAIKHPEAFASGCFWFCCEACGKRAAAAAAAQWPWGVFIRRGISRAGAEWRSTAGLPPRFCSSAAVPARHFW